MATCCRTMKSSVGVRIVGGGVGGSWERVWESGVYILRKEKPVYLRDIYFDIRNEQLIKTIEKVGDA